MQLRSIKYYSNRKLYDIKTSSYVNHEDLIQFMRNGYDIQVISNKDKTDITPKIKARMVEIVQGANIKLIDEIIRRGN